MKEMIRYILLLGLIPKGYTETQCATYEDTTLKCIFSRNVNATQTEFRVYFYSDNGNEELLIDCVWMDGEIQCLRQEGFQYKQPVSEIAEISVPTRYKGRSGTYRCIDNGSGPEDVMPCRFYERHKERQREINVPQTTSIILQYNDEEEQANNTPVIASSVSGAVAFIVIGVIITVISMKRLKKSLKKSKLKISDEDQFREFLLQAEESNNVKFERSAMTFPRAYSSHQDPSKKCNKNSSTIYSITNENKPWLKKNQTL